MTNRDERCYQGGSSSLPPIENSDLSWTERNQPSSHISEDIPVATDAVSHRHVKLVETATSESPLKKDVLLTQFSSHDDDDDDDDDAGKFLAQIEERFCSKKQEMQDTALGDNANDEESENISEEECITFHELPTSIPPPTAGARILKQTDDTLNGVGSSSSSSAATKKDKSDHSLSNHSNRILATFPKPSLLPSRLDHDAQQIGLKNYSLDNKALEKRKTFASGSREPSWRKSFRTATNWGNRGIASSSRELRARRTTNGLTMNSSMSSRSLNSKSHHAGGVVVPRTVEEMEEEAREKAISSPCCLLWLGNVAAVKVIALYLVTWETWIACLLTAGMTVYWYKQGRNADGSISGFTVTSSSNSMDFILLAFAVTSPIIAVLGMAYTR